MIAPSPDLAARSRTGCFLGLFLLAGWLALVTPLRADNPPTFLYEIDASALPGGFDPYGVALDNSNNVCVTDGNARVEKFDNGGIYLTQWGSYGTNNGQFNYPEGVAVDGMNNIYVVDSGNARVEKFDSNGNYLTQWGSFGSGNGQFNSPIGVAVDNSNNVYVTDYINSRVEKFTSSGSYLTSWGAYGSRNGQFVGPASIAVDSGNNVYVTDPNSYRVEKFDSNGNYLTQWERWNNGQFRLPTGIAVDGMNNIYVVDSVIGRIAKFDGNGNYLTQWGSLGTNNGQFSGPIGVAVDISGNFIYVADTGNARIQVFVNNASIVPPIITSQPVSQTVPAGINVIFSISVVGTAPLAYQWASNNVAVSGATNATFTLTNVSLSDSATYSVLVTNNFGSELTRNAVLTVLPALVTTQPASGLSAIGAVLNGSVTVGPVETVVWFEWGTDTNYGNIAEATIVPGNNRSTNIAAALGGLSGNIYHYRLDAANDYGIVYGADQEFAMAQTVLNTNDGGPGSLRQAIGIGFPVSITFNVTGTIALTNGELLITNDLTIIGPGSDNLAFSGNNTNRVFEIGSNAMVTISGLTIRDGHAADGYPSGGDGGGVYNLGTLNLFGCVLTNNTAGNGNVNYNAGGPGWDGGAGGGIYNANTLQATACAFTGNQAGFGGAGASYGSVGGDGGAGGGIYNLGTMRLTNCTLSANQSGRGGAGADGSNGGCGNGGAGGDGGGIGNSGAFVLVACTLSANSAGSGGLGGVGCFPVGGRVGSGGSGGGIFNSATQPSAQLLDTLVASNSPGSSEVYPGPGAVPDLAGPFTSLGYNLIGQTNGGTGFTNGVNADLAGTTVSPLDPQLGPLANNGGPTPTMALLHGSPALAAGDDALPGPPYNLTTDQRGFPRNSGAPVDIGAFQFQPSATLPALITSLRSADSGFQLVFANTSSATFSVLTATNFLLPLNNWTVIGQALELAPGQFQFTDLPTTNAPQRFYRVSSP